jgi:hypothetical protein
MANYKLTPNIEFDDNYLQAKNDILKLFDSFSKLNDKQKEHLIKEVVGIAQFDTICQLLNSILNNN